MTEGEVIPLCEYDQKTLHLPVNPQGAVLEVCNLIKQNVTMKLVLKDERTVIGSFSGFDKFGNFVLTTAKEYFREEVRKIHTIIVPLDFVDKVFSKPAEVSQEGNDEAK